VTHHVQEDVIFENLCHEAVGSVSFTSSNALRVGNPRIVERTAAEALSLFTASR